METYGDRMKAHLARYREEQLGVTELGLWEGQPYPHILPFRLRELNILDFIRADFWTHASAGGLRFHKYFHHLNSSQAFAINLFFPLIQAGGSAPAAGLSALGLSCEAVENWEMEVILDLDEGTNFDVCASTLVPGAATCSPGIEVKLTETSFGPTKNDKRHRESANGFIDLDLKARFTRMRSAMPSSFGTTRFSGISRMPTPRPAITSSSYFRGRTYR